jgi:hypothetical protein
MSKRQTKATPYPVEAPSKITATHSRDQTLRNDQGQIIQQKGWKNHGEHPLSLALARDQIDNAEYSAGNLYRVIFSKISRGTRDSTDFSMISGGGGAPFTQSQVDAIRSIEKIERHLPFPWNILVRKFCGEGYEAREAARAASFNNPRDVWPKTRIALNKLYAAISACGINNSQHVSD